MKKPKTVEEYISQAPDEARGKLKEMRAVIRKTAPKAEERISYSMPYYDYHGRLAYFAFAKKHIGLYIPPPITQEFQKELGGYVTSKSAIQFPLDKKLSITLIKKLVKARMKMNEAKRKK